MAFVLLVEARLHVAESQSLKSKRQVVRSVKDALRERLGAAVAEVGGQDTWQRAALLCALVGREQSELRRRGETLEEIVVARAGEGVEFEWTLRSLEDLRG